MLFTSFDQNTKILNAFLGFSIWVFITLFIGFMATKSFKFRNLVEGEPTILIENGKIKENALAKQNMTFDDLITLLRQMNAFNLSDVKLADPCYYSPTIDFLL